MAVDKVFFFFLNLFEPLFFFYEMGMWMPDSQSHCEHWTNIQQILSTVTSISSIAAAESTLCGQSGQCSDGKGEIQLFFSFSSSDEASAIATSKILETSVLFRQELTPERPFSGLIWSLKQEQFLGGCASLML